MNSPHSENGYTLIEALVALSVLALGIASAAAVLANTAQAHMRAEHRTAAEVLISELLLTGEPGQGTHDLTASGPTASWQFTRTEIETAQLAGAPASWIETAIIVSWTWRDVETQATRNQVHIERPASP